MVPRLTGQRISSFRAKRPGIYLKIIYWRIAGLNMSKIPNVT
jgi:hypothetical protein